MDSKKPGHLATHLVKATILLFLLSLLTLNASAGEQFKHQYLTLDLPDGWTTGPIPAGSAKETIGVLKAGKIPGASITLDCHRGPMHTHASTRIRGLGTLSAVYPQGQKMLKKPYRVKAKGGKGNAELWQGFIKAGDITVALQSPMAELKTRDCWLVMIGFTPESTAAQLEKDFLTILKSAR